MTMKTRTIRFSETW